MVIFNINADNNNEYQLNQKKEDQHKALARGRKEDILKRLLHYMLSKTSLMPMCATVKKTIISLLPNFNDEYNYIIYHTIIEFSRGKVACILSSCEQKCYVWSLYGNHLFVNAYVCLLTQFPVFTVNALLYMCTTLLFWNLCQLDKHTVK